MIAPLAGPFLHERWFVEQTPGNDWSFFLSPLPLALTATIASSGPQRGSGTSR